MRKIHLFSILALLFFPLIFQAKSIIKINFPGAKGHQAIVWTYDDLISYREKVLVKSEIDNKNNFSFTLTNKDITPIRIQVEFFRIDLYIEPNKNYEIEIDSVDFSIRDFYPINIIGYLTPPFKIISPNTDEINTEMNIANQEFAQFFDTNYIYLYQSRLPEVVMKKFVNKMDSLKNQSKSLFLKKHIEIQRTQLRMMTRQTGVQWVADNYFTSGKIQYNNKIYMDYFNSFWSKYLLVSLRGLRFGELDSIINTGSYFALVRLIEKDPLLKNAQIREMVVLRNIIQMYSDYRFSKEALGDILSDIANKGVTAENRKIAINIRKQMLENVDNKAPDFSIPDFTGEIHQLKEFEGKYIYLNFWNEECPKCIAEMDLTKDLFLDFDDVIQFVSIYVGPDKDAAASIISSRGYKWLQLDYNHDFELIKNYKLEIFPYYILINKAGEIEWYPAHTPSEGFNSYFIKMLNEKKGNLK